MRRKVPNVPASVPLAIVLFVCTTLCGIWAAFMPIFAPPDEMAHYDYAAFLKSAGGYFYLTGGIPADAADPKTQHLAALVAYRSMRYNPYATVPADYAGRLRSDACGLRDTWHAGSVRAPYVLFAYPPAYYFVAVATMKLSDALPCPSPIREFFAARGLGIVLLVFTLFFWHQLLRLIGASPASSSLLVFGAGSLPVVSSLFASVQPDALSAACLAATTLFAAHWLASPAKLWPPVLAIVLLVTLACVKEQYALAAWLGTALVAIEVARHPRAGLHTRALALLALLSIAPIAFVASHSLLVPNSALQALSRANAPQLAIGAPFSGALDGLRDIYYDGSAFRSFWSSFGVRGSEALAPIVLSIVSYLSIGTFIALAFTGLRAVIAPLLSPGKPKRQRALFTWLASFHFGVSYLALTAIVLAVYVRQSGGFQMEGRYWVPVLGAFLALFARAVIYARGVVIGNRMLTIGAIVFSVFTLGTQCSALSRLSRDYYGTPRVPRHETVAAIDAVGSLSLPGVDGEVRVAARPAVPLDVSGFAVDMESGLPARRVILQLGNRRIEARVGLPAPFVARIFNDRELRNSGFSATIELSKSAGRLQRMNGYVIDASGVAIPFQKSIDFVL